MQPANDKHRIGSMIAVLILVFMAAENNRPVFSKQLLAGLIKLMIRLYLEAAACQGRCPRQSALAQDKKSLCPPA